MLQINIQELELIVWFLNIITMILFFYVVDFDIDDKPLSTWVNYIVVFIMGMVGVGLTILEMWFIGIK